MAGFNTLLARDELLLAELQGVPVRVKRRCAGTTLKHRIAGGFRGLVARLDVIRAVIAEDPLSVVVVPVRADCYERLARLRLTLVVLRVLLRHTHAHQRSGDGAQASSDSSATKGSGERSRSNERADARDGQSANPDQPAA